VQGVAGNALVFDGKFFKFGVESHGVCLYSWVLSNIRPIDGLAKSVTVCPHRPIAVIKKADLIGQLLI
jgi:hypothetical protein